MCLRYATQHDSYTEVLPSIDVEEGKELPPSLSKGEGKGGVDKYKKGRDK